MPSGSFHVVALCSSGTAGGGGMLGDGVSLLSSVIICLLDLVLSCCVLCWVPFFSVRRLISSVRSPELVHDVNILQTVCEKGVLF
jgi:hypothetical protein